MVSKILKIAAHGVFAARGWTFEPLPADWQPKQVIIGFPHTTWTDTLMAFSGFAIVEQKGHVVVKQEAFRWPFGGLLKALGGVAIDRKSISTPATVNRLTFTWREIR